MFPIRNEGSWLNQRMKNRIDELADDQSEIIDQIKTDLQILDRISRQGI